MKQWRACVKSVRKSWPGLYRFELCDWLRDFQCLQIAQQLRNCCRVEVQAAGVTMVATPMSTMVRQTQNLPQRRE